METNSKAAWQQAHDQAQALHDQLDAATATNADDSETLGDALFAVDDILTALNQEDMASRTGQMQAVASELASGVKDLSELKDELADIAKRVGTVADIADKVDSLLGACKSLLPA